MGKFEATGCDVFEKRVAFLLGRYVAGTVFQVGFGATRGVLPAVIYDPELDYPADWHDLPR